jgi:serine/threonine protein kinase/tetratricopeptide (TPR) repeat protein
VADAPRGTEDGLIDAARRDAALAAPAETVTASGGSGVIGQTIGPYKLLSILGEGGMGTVYLAEQAQPVRRRVALKIIKLGMDTRSVIARFEAERQALAMMDHPNVAKVFDAGTTEAGRPYFVMEHVAGIPITEHCDRHRLSTPERLELFDQVCQAVQHAHTKGVIHRDIKPSNVLVSIQEGRPHARVIDFGVAKATAAHLTEKTLYTEQGQLIGTPAYMSPEQAEMTAQDIDTRSDIYSLGVPLYELLTGATPFDARTLLGAGYVEMLRIIREVEPPKPSTRLSSLSGIAPPSQTRGSESADDIASRRKSDPRTLIRAIRGDLDWIVMKCLEKDRSRRYETANGLAMEIQRYLNNEPVLAAPPSAVYRARRFIRRHKLGVIVGIAIAGVFVLGIAGTTSGMLWALREQGRAEHERHIATENEKKSKLEAAKAKAATDFLRNMFASADPLHARGRDVTVREVLDETSATVEQKLADQPEVQAQVRRMIGDTYVGLGLGEPAIPHVEYALAWARKNLGNEHEWTLSTLRQLGLAHHLANNNKEFVAVFEEYLATARRLFAEDHPTTVDAMCMLGNAYDNFGDYKKAEPLLVRANELAERLYSKGDWRLVGTRANLGNHYRSLGRFSEAEKVYSESLAESNVSPQFKVRWQKELAEAYRDQGKLDKAEETARAALEKAVRILGNEHPETVMTMRTLAGILALREATSEAEDLYRKAIDASRPIHSSRRQELRESLTEYVGFLDRSGRFNDAEQQLLAMLDVERQSLGDSDPDTLASWLWLTRLAATQGAVDRARGYLASQVEPRRAMLLSSKATAQDLSDYALGLLTIEPEEIRDPRAALPLAEKAVELNGRKNPEFLETLAIAYRMLGEFERSRQTYEEILPLALSNGARSGSNVEHGVIEGLLKLIDSVKGDDVASAMTAQVCDLTERAARTLLAKRQVERHEMTHVAQSYLAAALVKCGKFAEAEPMVRESFEHRKASLPPQHWLIGNSMSLLGETLFGQGKFAEAETLLVDGYAQMTRDPQVLKSRQREALDRIIRLYAAWNKAVPSRGYDQKSAEWRAKLEAWEATTQPATTQSTVTATQPATSHAAGAPHLTSSAPATKS